MLLFLLFEFSPPESGTVCVALAKIRVLSTYRLYYSTRSRSFLFRGGERCIFWISIPNCCKLLGGQEHATRWTMNEWVLAPCLHFFLTTPCCLEPSTIFCAHFFSSVANETTLSLFPASSWSFDSFGRSFRIPFVSAPLSSFPSTLLIFELTS